MRVAGQIASCVALAAACLAGAQAQNHSDASGDIDHVLRGLPDLPASANAPGHFNLAGESASMGYATRFEKWNAKVDQYLGLSPHLTVDYGLLLTSKLSAGGTFTRQDTLSEVVLNGIYAPQHNVRLRLTGAQLRNAGGFAPAASRDSAVLQNSLLLNARKYWNKYLFLSDLGLTAYSTQANAQAMASNDTDRMAPGRMDGYMLNLGVRPTAESRIDMRREFSHLSYTLGEDALQSADQASTRMKFSQHLGDCVRLQGGYTASSDNDRLDLNLARRNWNINLSRDQGGSNTALMIGYTVPLGVHASRGSKCGSGVDGAPSFESIVDASVKRPAQLPREPLFAEMP